MWFPHGILCLLLYYFALLLDVFTWSSVPNTVEIRWQSCLRKQTPWCILFLVVMCLQLYIFCMKVSIPKCFSLFWSIYMVLFTVLWSRFPVKTCGILVFGLVTFGDFPPFLTNFLSSLESPFTAFVPQRFLTEFIFIDVNTWISIAHA